MKRRFVCFFLILLLCCGCSPSGQSFVYLPEPEEITKITVVNEYTGVPDFTFRAKETTVNEEIHETISLFDAFLADSLSIWKEEETLYGGTAMLVLMYEGDTITKRIALYPNEGFAVIDDVTYSFETEESISSMFASLDLPSRLIKTEEIDSILS